MIQKNSFLRRLLILIGSLLFSISCMADDPYAPENQTAEDTGSDIAAFDSNGQAEAGEDAEVDPADEPELDQGPNLNVNITSLNPAAAMGEPSADEDGPADDGDAESESAGDGETAGAEDGETESGETTEASAAAASSALAEAADLSPFLVIGLNANHVIHRGEGPRMFDIYIPAGVVDNPALVIDMHPLGTSKEYQRTTRKLYEVADETGEFIIAWPQGIEGSWNAGDCCMAASYWEIDDVGFIREMVDVIDTKININWDKIYATGYSNGSSMSHKMAYMAPDLITAIATNHFHFTDEQFEEAKQQPTVPIPVLSIHGYNDQVVCWQDVCPNSVIELGEIFGIMSAYQHGKRGWHKWAEINGCNSNVTTFAEKGLFDLNHGDYKWKKGYQECSAGVEVRQILNSRNHMGEFLGPNGAQQQGDYNREVWDFLSQWSKDEILDAYEAEDQTPAELEGTNFVDVITDTISGTIEDITTITTWFPDTVADIFPEDSIIDNVVEAVVDVVNTVIITLFSWF